MEQITSVTTIAEDTVESAYATPDSSSGVTSATTLTDTPMASSPDEQVSSKAASYDVIQITDALLIGASKYRSKGIFAGKDGNTYKLSVGDGFYYDGTTLTVSGGISGGTIDIGGSDSTSFHVDADGNMWLGAASFASGTFSVTNGGVMNATSATVNQSIIANQDIFGDGSDGIVTISADTTLTTDMFYDSLTISTSGTSVTSPAAGATAGDGSASATSASATFATLRAAAGTASDSGTGTTNTPQIAAHASTSGRFTNFTRGMLVFDTSGIPDGATILSANLQLYVTAKSDQMSQSVSIVTSADPGTIANADFNIANWTMTKQATDVTIASVTTASYNTWTLNATGLSNVSKTGKTILGVVISGDADNTAPTWSAGAVASVTYDTADLGSNPPVLTVAYTYSPTVNTGGYRIFVKDTLTVQTGTTISRNGNNGGNGGNASGNSGGSAGSAGAALASGSIYGSTAGQSGGAGANANGGSNAGVAGTSLAKIIGSAGSAGGHGGDKFNAGFSNGGAAGAGTGTVYNKPQTANFATQLYDVLPTPDILRSSAGSGSGGSGRAGGAGAGGSGGGGGSGSSGGIVSIIARLIVNAGTITATGGNGGNGGNGDGTEGEGGGGGAGGPGGKIVLVYTSLTNTGTIAAAGGTGGTAGSHTYVGTGSTVASNGSNGLTSSVIQLQV